MKCEWLDEYLLSKLGVTKDFKEESKWDRYLLKDKLIAAICTDKTGREIITLKCDPLFSDKLRIQYEDIVPGYHMNKFHWNSVYLEGEVPDEVIKNMIDQSYELILNKLSKKMQNEIMNNDKKIESRCEILCSACDYSGEMGCKGCINIKKLFWGENCPVKSCCENKKLEHCGECENFLCDLLKKFSYDKEQGDNGLRIKQCRKWND